MTTVIACDGPGCDETIAQDLIWEQPDVRSHGGRLLMQRWLTLDGLERPTHFHNRTCLEQWAQPQMTEENDDGVLREVILRGVVIGRNPELGYIFFRDMNQAQWVHHLHWATDMKEVSP